jgi:hypothetical protein
MEGVRAEKRLRRTPEYKRKGDGGRRWGKGLRKSSKRAERP